MNEKFYVYVLKSVKDGNLYTGYTSDLEKRLFEHNSGLSKATKGRSPFELVYKEEYDNRSDAMKREKFLKTGKGRDFLKTRVSNN